METSYYKGSFLALIALFVLLEVIWSWKNDRKVYQLHDTLANLAILAGFHLSKFIFTGYQLTVLALASGLAPFSIPRTGWSFALVFLLADFIYYWFHRASHSWKPLWAFHLIHHSSRRMNLTTAYRLNWFGALISPVFFVPLALLGFPPDLIVLSYALNLVYQFFLHTEAVGKLGPAEGIVDTPSAHRVHHGSNALYIDKNFGGVLLIWDRLFGTYQPETEQVIYGTASGITGNNPFRLVFQGFVDLFRKQTPPKK